MYCVIKLVK